jgi:hypothetical protein
LTLEAAFAQKFTEGVAQRTYAAALIALAPSALAVLAGAVGHAALQPSTVIGITMYT